MSIINKLAFLSLLCVSICFTCGNAQSKTYLPKAGTKSDNKEEIDILGPKRITRNVIQDRKGNIWMASWDGVFRYDGKSYTNITSKVSSARFFSLLEDRKGNMWFGTIGSGVYYYDGRSFQNFTTEDGLLNNEVGSIYEDKKGNIWFGVSGGASRYDGVSFRNYIINGTAMKEDRTGKTFADRSPYGVNSILEDKTGKFWFGTTGNTFVYDGSAFTEVTNNSKPFTSCGSIIEDRKGNIWLTSNGLWRYDGTNFTNFAENPVLYLHEGRSGNIWTSSPKDGAQNWVLSCYHTKSFDSKKPTVTEINPGVGALFGILEAYDGSIWFGAADGVHKYESKTIADFIAIEGKK
jgi:ligand-binding sensor domain-containing protein